jgi:hypothetical protein
MSAAPAKIRLASQTGMVNFWRMIRFARLLLLVGLLGFGPGLAAAEQPKLTFAGQEFSLAYVDLGANGVINQYVPPGEKVETWTTLLTVQQAPQAKDASVVAEAVLKVATGNSALVSKPQVLYRGGTKNREDVMLLLLIHDPSHLANELSIQRFVKEPGAVGVKTYIFGRRITTGAENPAPEQMNAWIQALWDLKLDTFKAMP